MSACISSVSMKKSDVLCKSTCMIRLKDTKKGIYFEYKPLTTEVNKKIPKIIKIYIILIFFVYFNKHIRVVHCA